MYRLRILVNDRPIPIYTDKNGQLWVEAREGTTFKVKVENNSFNRVLAVISVDGLNAINAKHEDPMQAPGYVLDSYRSIGLPGWKVSDGQVREFVFTTKENSYASKIGAPQNNVGVIGAAIISEQPNWYYSVTYGDDIFHQPYWNKPIDTGSPYRGSDFNIYSMIAEGPSSHSSGEFVTTSNSSNNMTVSQVAVGSGQKQEFRTHDVNFTRNKVETILSVRYDSRENLIAKGIIIENGPVPFPVNSPYCPDV